MSGALAGLSQYDDSDSDHEVAIDSKADQQGSGYTERFNQKVQDGAERNVTQDKPTSAGSSSRPKRKLPPLEAESLHQAEEDAVATSSPAPAVSSAKKVARGDWLCYCFIEVPIERSLSKLLQECHAYLQQQLGPEHELVDLRSPDVSLNSEEKKSSDVGSADATPTETGRLHISLTRPFTVRSYERDEYVKTAKAEIHRLKETVGSFAFSFSRFALLSNDDESRHFVVLEVGPGREEFHKLSSSLSTELRRAFRAKSYYEEARFHTSTAYLHSLISADGGKPTEAALGPRFSALVEKAETKWGSALRKCSPMWATRIGIQVANRITYVDL